MCSPVGHSLAGLAGSQLGTPVRHRYRRWWVLFAMFAGVAPDLDFVPGLLVGDINRFHHTWTHTIVAAVAFGVLAGLVLKRFTDTPVRLGVWSGLIYGSHLLIDWMTYDARPPYGIPLFLPFSDAYFISPVSLFGGVMHGVPGDSTRSVVADSFSLHNLTLFGSEVAVLLPVLAVTWWIGRRRRTSPG